MYDVVFISYDEMNAEENWLRLCARFPHAKRLHGVKGIHEAHIAAAHMVKTELFYCVDGDAVIDERFMFDYVVEPGESDHVHVFRARNPVNDLIYGYGAVKLLPTADVLRLTATHFKPDMTTSINRKYKVVHQLSNITAFNTSEFNAWRSAFRECVKLSSKTIPGQIDAETEHRLDIWCTSGEDKLHGHWCMYGAQHGRQYGMENRNNRTRLFLINDREWLWHQFTGNSG